MRDKITNLDDKQGQEIVIEEPLSQNISLFGVGGYFRY